MTGVPDVTDEAADDRGRLEVALGVVRRVAERAADLTEGTARSRRPSPSGGGSGSTARVTGRLDVVDLRLDVPLAYPVPVPTTVEAVRENVRERVHTLTGYTVRAIDVTVSALVGEPASPDPEPDTAAPSPSDPVARVE